jgi:hypothetical protein
VKREVVLAAVRKETVEDYAALLAQAGFQPEFTLAGLARNYLCPAIKADYAILEAGAVQTELISFENAAPASLRLFPTKMLTGEVIRAKTAARILYISGPDGAASKLVDYWGFREVWGSRRRWRVLRRPRWKRSPYCSWESNRK